MTKEVYKEQRTEEEVAIGTDSVEDTEAFEATKKEIKKQADEAKAKLKLTQEQKATAQKEAEKLTKQLEKYIAKYGEKTGEKIILGFVAVDKEGYTKRGLTSAGELNEMDGIFLGSALAGFILNDFK